ncbi:MAG: sodium/proton-translocating pyrophosphatase, partial [Candidatus Aenigmarchaeota archaeon]|nr:sodium/proton-translocating pyrophosphatase [Candidatus Aenigmarchaeota archaeon]
MFEYLPWIAGFLAILFAGITAVSIKKKPIGTEQMKEISGFIHKGALTYLNKQYKYLTVFVIVVAAVLYLLINPSTATAFVIGAFFSALTGNIGMRVATSANARTSNASKESLNSGLRIAFSSGTVMGMIVVGLGLLGVSLMYMIFQDTSILFGFGFGASSIAL